MRFSGAIAVACALGASTSQLLRYNPPSQPALSYVFAAARPNASSDASDIFIQVQGPASMSWIAVGQGRAMKGSQMFIIYADAAGNNVSLSPRLSGGHSEPTPEDNRQVKLLAGSGIANGNMTANILCQKCDSWQGGAMNLSGSGQSWIWASKKGDPIKSDSLSASIQQHDDNAYGSFVLDLSAISASGSSNPFLETTNVQTIQASSTTYDGPLVPTHGAFMSLAFVIGFPLGAFLIRLASFRGLVWIHAAIQLCAYLGAIIGLGLGVYIANQGAADLSAFHPVFGIIIVVLLVFQPILGYIHHLQYKRYQTTSPYTLAHVWFGRFVVTAGIIDGVFGLTLAGKSTGLLIVYCLVAGAVWLLWIATVIYTRRRQQRVKERNGNIRMASLVDSSHGYN